MKLDLAPSQREEVLQLLEQALGPEAEVFAFGSRVQGNARPFSDLDLLLKSAKPISYAQLAEAEELLAESDLPFTVDLLDEARISHEFQQRIKPDLMKLKCPVNHCSRTHRTS